MKQFVNRLLAIGLTPDMPFGEQKRVKIVNGIAVVVILIGLMTIQELFHVANGLDLLMFLFSPAISVLILYLNHKHQHCNARLIVIFFFMFYLTGGAIIFGAATGTEYFLFAVWMGSMLLFDEKRWLITFSIMVIVCFLLTKLSFKVMLPLRTNHYNETFYYFYMNIVASFGICFVALYTFKKEHLAYESMIETERRKSDDLLLNILPVETARELKQFGYSRPQLYERVTVLFTDFVGFTHIAARLTPEDLVKDLDTCFAAFDEIVGRHHLEKIKTIGDAYMAAGGIPLANQTNPLDVVTAAQEMMQWMENWAASKRAHDEEPWRLRVGIHTGPLVAGVVGKKKFAYDIWGDAVNIAARMESSGEAGKINISGETYELVKDQFACEHRGKVYAKNKGEVEMYFVTGRSSQL